MGPNFDAFAWLHGLALLSLTLISLAAFVATCADHRELRNRQDQERRQRLARLHADADQVRRGEIEA